jgi:hypothetical protein
MAGEGFDANLRSQINHMQASMEVLSSSVLVLARMIHTHSTISAHPGHVPVEKEELLSKQLLIIQENHDTIINAKE